MNQKTTRWLKTIGIVLVAGSLWPATRVVLAALKPPVAITLTPLNYKDKDEGVYKTPPVSPDVIVNFDFTAATPLNPGFNGFNSSLKNAVEYYDPNYQCILKTLSPGWLRFPGGTDSEAFDWASGEIVSAWIDRLKKNDYQQDINENAQPIVAGKGGSSFSDFAKMAANVGGAKIIVSVNAFTDTPESAQAFAQYALTNHIPVAAWELANEPYTWLKFGKFFKDATDYAKKMKPFRDAIKAADPNAVVALYFSEAGQPNTTWDDALANYSPKYWDAVTYHEYVPPGNPTTFENLMATANGNLFFNTTSHVTDYLMPRNKSGVTYLISEVSPSDGQGGPSVGTVGTDKKDGPLLGSLYGGIYSAEFALRMSTLPQVKYVASFQVLSSRAGIEVTNDCSDAVVARYEKDGTTTNTSTSGFNFGFFLSAQAAGEAVANGALHNSIWVYATTTTGGPTVSTDGRGSIPAVYAQAYEGGNGKRYVVLTNKSNSTMVAQIEQNGVVPTNQTNMTFVTGSDGSLTNTNPPPNDVQIQGPTVTNPGAVTIPPYSVVRLEWTVDDTTPPVTTAEAAGPSGLNGWYVGPTVVDFTATDDLSGVLTTEFSLDNGARWTTGNTISVSGNAIHNILYHSIDLDGNVETPKSITIMLDSKPPVTTVSTSPRTFGGLEVDLKAVDNVSGVAETEYSLNGSTWKTGNAFFLCGGTYTMLYRSTDVAGNVEKRKSITINAPSCPP